MLNGREVARAARRSIDVARGRLREGDALVLFAEGTRSRTGGMQSMLAGVARYLDVPGTWVLPVGLAGPEALFPVEVSALRPARVVLQLGRPLRASALVARAVGDRRLVMDAIGLAVAEALPPEIEACIGTRTTFRTRRVSFMIRETRHNPHGADAPQTAAARGSSGPFGGHVLWRSANRADLLSRATKSGE